jgi:two-component system NtrC family response regulator
MNEKVLVVDDDEVLGRVLQRILTHEGYLVLHAATLGQALQLDQDQRPYLGLLDLCLPDGDGIQLANTLQAQHPGLPLILMTAYPVRLRENAAATQRFVRVLTKPLNVRELRQTIATSLTAAAVAEEVPQAATPVCAAAERPSTCLPREVPAFSFFRA